MVLETHRSLSDGSGLADREARGAASPGEVSGSDVQDGVAVAFSSVPTRDSGSVLSRAPGPESFIRLRRGLSWSDQISWQSPSDDDESVYVTRGLGDPAIALGMVGLLPCQRRAAGRDEREAERGPSL